MPLSTLMNDSVTLVKADGTRHERIRASVQPGLILTGDARLPIEEGDRFERLLPSGQVESYEVIEPGFFARVHGMPAHFQSKVRRVSKLPAQPPAAAGVVYNVTGNNARVNIGSTDTSTNIVDVQAETLFAQLRQTVEASINDAETKRRILEAVDGLESDVDKPTFLQKYSEFMAAAANHVTALAPFIPALSQMLARATSL